MMRRKSKRRREGYKCFKCKHSQRLSSRNQDIKPPKTDDGPSNYVVYCIVNSGFFSNRGHLVASVARAFLSLYNKIDGDKVKSRALDEWEDSGEKLVVLEAVNHKHLVFLADEMQYAATGYHCFSQSWGRSKIMLVLSVLGREEDLEEPIDGLPQLT